MNTVVVVGAGLAGLAAARRLVAHGYEVTVVEARERVGGRTEGLVLDDGTPLELGGQWRGAHRSGASTGPAPSARHSGTATWKAPSAVVKPPQTRSPPCDIW